MHIEYEWIKVPVSKEEYLKNTEGKDLIESFFTGYRRTLSYKNCKPGILNQIEWQSQEHTEDDYEYWKEGGCKVHYIVSVKEYDTLKEVYDRFQ